MSPRLVFGLALILILSCGCQPVVNANVTTEDIQAVRLITSKEGYYRISSKDLQSIGFDAASGEQIQFIFKGDLYPYWFLEPSQGSEFNILFYTPPAGRYLTDQVFILEKKASGVAGVTSSVLPIRPEADAGNNQKVLFRKSLEPQLLYQSQAGIDDPWLWQNIDPREGIQVSFSLDGKELTGKTCELKLWSPTNAPTSPDHAIHVRLNGFNIGVFRWEGAGWKTISIPLELTSLGNNNEILLELDALDDVPVQKIYLDEILLEGKMTFIGDDHPMTFYGDGSLLQIEKSSSYGYLFEQDRDQQTLRAIEIHKEIGFDFETVNGARYDWIPENGFQEVDRIESIKWEIDLTDDETTVDWLVITPSQYIEVLQPLITMRNYQGLQPKLVDVQQIYDQFYGGSPDPQALSRFFKSAKVTWKNFPEYVLLIGDFTYEHQNYVQALEGIPSYFVQSAFAGETVSDLPLMDLDGDDLPDFGIGRIPVENAKQLENWIEKLIAYESNGIRSGFNEIIAVADDQEDSFSESASSFLSNFSNSSKTLLYQPEKRQDSVPEKIRSFFNGQTDILAYFGHGSINTWGKENLFSVEDVKKLRQSEFVPVIINFSCLTGYYIHPQISSIAEAVLVQKSGGSVAVVAPTSLTFQSTQSDLSTVISNEIQFDKNQRLGDLIKTAWRSMDPENPSSLEVMQTFILFGDPAMSIHP